MSVVIALPNASSSLVAIRNYVRKDGAMSLNVAWESLLVKLIRFINIQCPECNQPEWPAE
jgi:hypothetical protein